MGHIISLNVIRPQPEKVGIVKNFLYLKSPKEIAAFSQTSKLLQLICNLAYTVKPLTDLSRGERVKKHGKDTVRCMLQSLLSEDFVLSYPDFKPCSL